jgi:hypothetical protein
LPGEGNRTSQTFGSSRRTVVSSVTRYRLTCPWTSPTILTGGDNSINVGCDKNTSLAAAHTLAISAFFNGGLFVTLPEYPASSNRPIILSTSNTCRPAPGLEAVILFLDIVADNAAPGESELLELLLFIPDGPGDGDRPSGEVPIAEGGGEVPSNDERNPPAFGLARMVVLVGTRGEGGASVEDGIGDPAPRMGVF